MSETASETKIIRIIVDSSKAIDGSSAATRALQKVEQQTASMDATLAKVEKSLASVGGMLMANLALALAEVTSRLLDMTMGAFKAAAGLDEMAEQVGLNSRQMQGLQFAAVQAGVKIEQLETGVSKFSKKIGDAATGQKEMIEALDRLGVKILDAKGKLRPTADLLQETAQKIGELDDPAKKASAAVEFFGKSGQRMLTMLETMSKGLFEASDAAEKFGAMISERTSKKMDEISDAMERAKLKTRAFLAEGLMAIIDFAEHNGLDKVLEKMGQGLVAFFKFPLLLANAPQLGDFIDNLRSGFDKLLIAGVRFGAAIAEQFKIVWEFLDRNGLGAVLEAMQRGFESLVKTAWTLAAPLRTAVDSAKEAFDQMMVAGARFGAAFIETFKAIPAQLGQLFRDGVNNVLMALESGLPMITGALEKYAPWLGVKTTTISLGRLDGSSGSGFATGVNDYMARVGGAADAAEKAARERFGLGRDYAGDRARQRQADADRQRAEAELLAANDPAGRSSAVTPGASNPPPRNEGQSEAEKLKKLLATLKAAAEAQDQMADASARGDTAFREVQVHLEAQTKALEIYGGKLDATNPKILAVTKQVEALLKATASDKAAVAFNVETTALEKQNVILAAQNRLMGEAPEIQARELALIKAKQQAEKDGLPTDDLAFSKRKDAIEQGELLKKQSEELKQSAERWSTPFKNAFQAIQQAGADAWEAILRGGKLSFESVSEVARVSLRRVGAELLNLATIRPLVGLGAQALGNIGILSPASVSSMGFGGSIFGGVATGAASGAASGVAAGAISGGPSASAGLLTGVGTGFSLSGLFGGGSSGGGLFGGLGSWLNTPLGPVQGPIMPGAAALPGGISGLGNLTPLGIAGGLASMGFGAYNLFTSKTPLGMLGGGMGLIGGGLGLAAGAGLIGSAFGPIGTAVGLLGGLLGLFGGSSEPPIPPQPALDLSIGSFVPNGGRGFTASGYGMNGGGSLGTQAGTLGTTVSRLFRSADVSPIAGATYGGRIWSGVDHVLNGRTWADRPYTQTALLTPGGDQEFVTYNDGTRGLQAAADLLIAAVFKANVLRGGVSDVSPALRAGVTAYDPTTAKDVQTVIGLAGAYDKLGKVTGTAKEALDKISASFDDLADFADRAGLSMKPINDEIEKQSKRWAQDFIDNMLDPLALQLRALADEKDSALASAQYIRDHVAGVYVDMDKTVAYFTDKEAKLRDQFYGGAVESLQQAIDALSLGPLANLSPTTRFAALKNSYDTTLAQARANDPDAISRLAGVGTDFANSLQQNFSSGPVYEAYRQQILADLREMQAAVQGGSNASTAAPLGETSAATKGALQQVAVLQGIVEEQSRQITALMAKLGQTNDLLQRVATNQ